MGLFDTFCATVLCPYCRHVQVIEQQTKAIDPAMMDYSVGANVSLVINHSGGKEIKIIDKLPIKIPYRIKNFDVDERAEGYPPNSCSKCKQKFFVTAQIRNGKFIGFKTNKVDKAISQEGMRR